MSNISLAIVDDETLIVSLLSNFFNDIPEINVVFSAESGEEFLEKLKTEPELPEVIILDLKMKEKSGIDVLEDLKINYPDILSIVMSSHYNDSFTGFMLKTGVSAFIPKGISPQKLLSTIKEVHKNGFFFDQNQLDILRNQISSKVPEPNLNTNANLTEREIDVLKLICNQKTAKEIGDKLFISRRTVEGHKNSLFLKTETKNIAGLVIFAIQNNIIQVDDYYLKA